MPGSGKPWPRRRRTPLPFGDAGDIDGALCDIHRKCFRTDNLRERSVGISSRQVELKQPVRSLRISFAEERVRVARRPNVRNIAFVANDNDVGARPSQTDDARRRVRLMQRRRDVPPVNCYRDDQTQPEGDCVARARSKQRDDRIGIGALREAGIGPLEKIHSERLRTGSARKNASAVFFGARTIHASTSTSRKRRFPIFERRTSTAA